MICAQSNMKNLKKSLMKKNKLCVFVYDWVVRPLERDEIFPHNKADTEYRYFKMSQLNNQDKKELPLKYEQDGWTVIKKTIAK